MFNYLLCLRVAANKKLGPHNLIHFINACNWCEQNEILLCKSLLWSHYRRNFLLFAILAYCICQTCEYLSHSEFWLVSFIAIEYLPRHDNQLHIARMQQTPPMGYDRVSSLIRSEMISNCQLKWSKLCTCVVIS